MQVSSRTPTAETRYEYSSNNLLMSANIDDSRASIVYNERKLPSAVHYSTGYSLFYGYNAKNQRVYLADNRGYNVSYIYDAQSRLFEVRKSDDSSLITRFEYTRGLLSRKTLGNGAYTSFIHNKESKLVQQINYFPNGTCSSSNTYDYDLKGKVTMVTDMDNQTWSYKYDTSGQVIGWTSSSGEDIRYTYEETGFCCKEAIPMRDIL